MSDVCDARYLVEEGKNGFMCDPHSAARIAAALRRASTSFPMRLREMGQESRRRAESLFALRQILAEYEAVFAGARERALWIAPRSPARNEV